MYWTKVTMYSGSSTPSPGTCLVVFVTDKKGLGQLACPKDWKKYKGGMDSNINVM